jgi:hypothetical protein
MLSEVTPNEMFWLEAASTVVVYAFVRGIVALI